jgi:uncharacterized membrane protein YfhO
MNESLTYNYWSISAYTSSIDGNQLGFLDRMGYRNESDRVSIVRAPVVSTDSLLGVKYILSSYPIEGLELMEDMGTYNGKSFYYNPYALPMSFVYKSNTEICNSDAIELYDNAIEFLEHGNTFTYQNRILSKLLGEDVELYVPIENVEITESDENPTRYDFELPGENYLCYVNFPYSSYANINLNNITDIQYCDWLTPSVLYVPKDDAGNTKMSVEISAEYIFEQFYALNLDELKRVTDKLKENTPDNLVIDYDRISCSVTSAGDESLLMTVPYSDGWEIYRNGKKIQGEYFEECMISIPLEEGENEIELKYHIPGFAAGVLLTFVGLAITVGNAVRYTKKRKDNVEEVAETIDKKL